jgi:O-antigen biosynthesis protein WbqP
MSWQRTFDILISVLLFFPAFIICVVASFAIWLECRANPLFLQMRVGRHQLPFKLFKLRTMLPSTLNAASHEIGSDSVLRVGHFLRSVKIDELPQILNVLNGSMSFVGPRPCLPSQGQLIQERESRGIFRIRPGITGISQIRKIDMSDPVKLANSDAEYLNNQRMTVYFDCLIATIIGKGRGDATKNR